MDMQNFSSHILSFTQALPKSEEAQYWIDFQDFKLTVIQLQMLLPQRTFLPPDGAYHLQS